MTETTRASLAAAAIDALLRLLGNEPLDLRLLIRLGNDPNMERQVAM